MQISPPKRAIEKVFAMNDAGKSDKEIQDWIENQPNKAEIFNAFGRMVEAFSSKKS